MIDTSTERKAFLVNNLSDKDMSKKIKVRLITDSGICPMQISQLDGIYNNTDAIHHTSEEIDYNTSLRREFTTKRTDDKVTNALYDPDDEDRYVYISHAMSIINSVYNVIWYDTKYGDIIVVPDLETIGIADSSSDTNSNTFYNIKIDIIERRPSASENQISDYSPKYSIKENKSEITPETSQDIYFPKPNDITGIATYLLPLADIFKNERLTRAYMRHSDYFTTTGNGSKVVEVYSLGSTDTLFTDTDNNTYPHFGIHVFRVETFKHNTKGLHNAMLDDFLIIGL